MSAKAGQPYPPATPWSPLLRNLLGRMSIEPGSYVALDGYLAIVTEDDGPLLHVRLIPPHSGVGCLLRDAVRSTAGAS